MSGGVDSAVALLKAVEAGLEPVGVTLRLWIDPGAPDGERACCSPRSVRAARDACHALGVPHVGLDLRDGFHHEVVEEFVAGFQAGRTPNPCMRCNGSFRFAALAAFADRIGAARIATGHYARVRRRDGVALVARGADPAKDQSYMLAAVPSEILGAVLVSAGRADQGADPRPGRTGRARGGGPAREPGRVLRRRRRPPRVPRAPRRRRPAGGDRRPSPAAGSAATPACTGSRPGQRRGIGVAGPEPLYVLAVEAAQRPGRGRPAGGARAALGVGRPGPAA